MSEKLSDNRFKSGMMRLIEIFILKLSDHDKKFDNVEVCLDRFKNNFDILSSQMTEIELKVIEIDKRLATD